ncbi:MAG: sulfite exporter TauE/SafE family protein [Gammaproteobacteria bacterium]
MKINNPFYFGLFVALSVWSAWYLYSAPDTVRILQENWRISLTMVFGSFIAGATSEGGGAVAFPVFTKVLRISPLEAKIFSLAIQSVGMTAATLTIVFMRVPVEWRVILWASLGGLSGIVFGDVVVASFLPPALNKMLFTAMIVSFAVTLSVLTWRPRRYNDFMPVFGEREKLIMLLTGFLGGVMSGLVGNGIDIICFSVMVLLFRLSEKVSTPTSVILMALNAIAGFILHLFVVGGFTERVESYWLAAVPVVVVGAPLGAYFCTRLNNKTIAIILICLIVVELISSLWIIPLTPPVAAISLSVFLFFSLVYYLISRVSVYSEEEGGRGA